MVKKSDVRELDMSVDQALKYVISLGMVMPDDLPVKALPAQKPSKDGDTEHNNLRSSFFQTAFPSFQIEQYKKVILCVPTIAALSASNT